jgi:CheY-like chemotaxis protein
MRALLVDVLNNEGYDVTEAANGAEALIRLRAESFAVIILDKNMPGLSGLDLLPGLRMICPETP